MPVLVGALATALLHSPLLLLGELWIPLCCTLGCTGVPVGFVPAILAARRDPWFGAGSGFAVAFLSVGIGAIALAVTALLHGFQFEPEMLDAMAEELRTDGTLSETEIENTVSVLANGARFLPVLGAGLLALSGGVCGAVTGAFAGRRRPDPRWSDPHQGQPPA